jgi:hypothetical protein
MPLLTSLRGRGAALAFNLVAFLGLAPLPALAAPLFSDPR